MTDALPRNVSIRSAEPADAAALESVCRRAFPSSLTWQQPERINVAWWSAAIASQATDIELAELEGRIVGFCLLVTDEECWHSARARFRVGSKLTRGIGLLISKAGWRALTATAVSRLRTQPSEHLVTTVPIDREQRLWLELIAVAPVARGRRVATKLLDSAESHCREIGRAGIGLRVDSGNVGAIALYVGRGYGCTSTSPRACTYSLRLGEIPVGPPQAGSD